MKCQKRMSMTDSANSISVRLEIKYIEKKLEFQNHGGGRLSSRKTCSSCIQTA